MGEIVGDRYRVDIGSQRVELPLVPLGPELAISLLMTIDHGVAFGAQAGADLADPTRRTPPAGAARAAPPRLPLPRGRGARRPPRHPRGPRREPPPRSRRLPHPPEDAEGPPR